MPARSILIPDYPGLVESCNDCRLTDYPGRVASCNDCSVPESFCNGITDGAERYVLCKTIVSKKIAAPPTGGVGIQYYLLKISNVPFFLTIVFFVFSNRLPIFHFHFFFSPVCSSRI